MSAPVLAIVELRWWGHHPSSFAKFITEARNLGYRVIGLCPVEPAAVGPEFDSCIGDEGVTLVQMPGLGELAARVPRWVDRFRIEGLILWRQIARLIGEAESALGVRVDHVFFCMLDDLIRGWAPAALIQRLFPYPWSGIHLWPREEGRYGGEPPALSPAHAQWSFVHAKNCRRLFTIDEYFAQEIAASDPRRYSDKWAHFPEYEARLTADPAHPLAQRIRAQARGRRVVGLIGVMESRKGIHTLLETAHRSRNRDLFFVFVGAPIEGGRGDFERFAAKVSAQAPSNCLFHFEYLPTQHEYVSVMDAFDILFLAYVRFYFPSGNLAYAALLRKPVIVSDGGIMAKRVTKYRLGEVVPEDDVEGCIHAIEKIDGGRWRAEEARWDDYYATQSVEVLRDAFRSLTT